MNRASVSAKGACPGGRWAILSAAILLAGLAVGCAATDTGAGRDGEPQAVLASSGSAMGSYLAGRHARNSHDTTAAADYFAQALSEDPENYSLRHKTFLLRLAEGDVAGALGLAEQLATGPRISPMAELVLAVADMRQERYEAAAARLDKPAKRGFGTLLKPLLLAWTWAARGNAQEAMGALDGLKSQQAFSAFRKFHTALIKDHLGDLDGALAAYRETRKDGAVPISVTLGFGSLLRRLDQAGEARKVYGELLERAPENPAVLSALADLEAGRPATSPYDTVNAGVAEALHGAAGALARQRGGDLARIYAQLALFLDPDIDAARMLIGEILERDRRWMEALETYKAVPEASPFGWEAQIRVASSLDRLDRTEEAIAALKEMAGRRPDDTSAMVTMGDLLRARERYGEAAAAYDVAIARAGKPQARHWALFYARGIARERMKNWDLAEADLLKSLELRPEHPLVLNYLGYSWIEQGRHLERARKMIEQAVAKRPTDGYIVDSLGWALYRLKDYDGAVKQLDRAVELKPQDPVINDHLGDAYWRVGRRLEARFQWSHALSLDPEEEEVAKIKAKLEKGLASVTNPESGS